MNSNSFFINSFLSYYLIYCLMNCFFFVCKIWENSLNWIENEIKSIFLIS